MQMRHECLYLPGSVRQKAAMCSPEASLGRYFCFWASFPAIRIPWNDKQLLANHTEESPQKLIHCYDTIQWYDHRHINTFPPASPQNRHADEQPNDEKSFFYQNRKFMFHYFIFTFSPMAWCAASVTAIEPSNEMISASRAYMVLDNPRPPGDLKKKKKFADMNPVQQWLCLD